MKDGAVLEYDRFIYSFYGTRFKPVLDIKYTYYGHTLNWLKVFCFIMHDNYSPTYYVERMSNSVFVNCMFIYNFDIQQDNNIISFRINMPCIMHLRMLKKLFR